MTVNVFHPYELLPSAWHSRQFGWRPEDDEVREAALGDAEALARFTERAATGWDGFLAATGEELGIRDPLVSSPRGDLPYSALLAFQRWHTAFHYRQLLDVADSQGVLLDGLDLTGLEDLSLPAGIY